MTPPQSPQTHPRRAWFITGTDTGIGKTYVACALLHALRQQGFSAIGMKPVAAGTGPTGATTTSRRCLPRRALPRRARW